MKVELWMIENAVYYLLLAGAFVLCVMTIVFIPKFYKLLKEHFSPIRCPECKYYFAPVCTFHKNLPMTSRHGYCHHAVKGKYEGGTPTVWRKQDEDTK